MNQNFFIKGKVLPADKKAVAIVGSRITSKYWEDMAYEFSYQLAKSGITIVSGLARGIDTIAHNAALDAGGRTLAVLGSGVNVIYPKENKELANKITQNGALVSIFSDNSSPLPENFLARNKVIVELSLCVVVIGGRRRSGTLSTAAHAANAGKEVFVVPGLRDDPLSEAGFYLLENGATLVKDAKEVSRYVADLGIV